MFGDVRLQLRCMGRWRPVPRSARSGRLRLRSAGEQVPARPHPGQDQERHAGTVPSPAARRTTAGRAERGARPAGGAHRPTARGRGRPTPRTRARSSRRLRARCGTVHVDVVPASPAHDGGAEPQPQEEHERLQPVVAVHCVEPWSSGSGGRPGCPGRVLGELPQRRTRRTGRPRPARDGSPRPSYPGERHAAAQAATGRAPGRPRRRSATAVTTSADALNGVVAASHSA